MHEKWGFRALNQLLSCMGTTSNVVPPPPPWLGTPPPLGKAASVVAGGSWVSRPEIAKLAKICGDLAHEL